MSFSTAACPVIVKLWNKTNQSSHNDWTADWMNELAEDQTFTLSELLFLRLLNQK
jgi:hypothetical protein